MGQLIAAIDQGTTSSRCVVFGEAGAVGVGQKEHRQIYPRAGWVEHDPLEIWERVKEVAALAVEKANAAGGEIAGIGITNQRETTVVWDRATGRPVANAIVWQDTRTKPICDEMAKAGGGADRFRAKTGLPLATYFSGPKLKWMLDNVEGVRAKAERGEVLFGTIDTWLVWNLTGGPRGGVHVTDVTNASRTMLMDLRSLQWDDGLLAEFGIPKRMMPRIVPSSDGEAYGTTAAGGPFGQGVRIGGVLGDQQAALVGQGCFQPGESKNTYGTGCFMLLNTGEKIVESKHGLLTTVGYQFAGARAVYALEGSIAVAGALVQWLRDNLGIIASSKEVEALARSVEDNGGVYFVPAFSGLFAPYWRSDARGVIVGMTQFTNRGHIARAALEGVAFQVAEILEAMEKDSGVRPVALKVDGGMTANELLMQFQADLLGVPVVRPGWVETTVLGAAVAAAKAVGCGGMMDGVRGEGKRWESGMKDGERKRLRGCWAKAIERSMGWVG